MNVKNLVLCGFCVIMTFSSFAQGKISGRVTDSAGGAALEFATITLHQSGDQKTINGSTTDKTGKFSIDGVKPGSYTLTAEFIGYSPFTFSNLLVDAAHSAIVLNNIHLLKKSATLETVTVTSRARLIDNKLDKLVFNAERDLSSQTGSATDILKKVPQVSVDIDGNVELAGNGGIRFLINGRPSAAFGSNVADVLQSIPANQIKSIEVVTNPGAKYDAQGMGGIINIILKKSVAKGVNGNLSLSAGTRANNGSFNFNARKNNFGVNAFVSGNLRPSLVSPTSTRRTSYDTAAKTVAELYQEGSNRVRRSGFQSGLGFDWTLNKHHAFSGQLGYDLFSNPRTASINQSQVLTDKNNNITSAANSVTRTNNKSSSHNIDAGLNYKKTFEKEGQELEIAASTSTENSLTLLDNYQLALPAQSTFYGNISRNPGKESESQVSVDYVQPISEDMEFTAGAKYNDVNIRSNANVVSFSAASQSYLPNNFLSNSLTYHQKVYAVYSELSFPVGELFKVKAGARYERTEISSFYSNAQQQVQSPGYNTFVPSIFLSKDIAEDQQLKLSYSKRIERPDYEDLNPFINTSDPKNIESGNPYLLPEIGHRVEVAYTRDLGNAGNIMASLYYRVNNQDAQPFIRYYPSYKVGDSTYSNVAVTMRQNIGTEQNAGVNLFADIHLNDKLGLRSNLFFFHRHTINTQDAGYNSNSFNYRLNANATYQFSGTVIAEFFGNFNSPRNEAQGRYPSFTTYSLAVRKQFWNKKGSLALTGANVFSKYVNQRTEVFGPNFMIDNFRRVPFRSFGLNFTWKFGLLEFGKEKDKEEGGAPAPPEGR